MHHPHACVSTQPRLQQVPITEYMRHVQLAFLENKYCHYFKWRLYYAMSGESNLKTVILQVCNTILNECIVYERAQLPNLSKSSHEKKKKKKNLHNCSPAESFTKPSTVTGSHGVQSEEQAKSYLDVTQLFGPSCVLLTERQNHVPACFDWPWGGGRDWKRFAREAGKTGSVCSWVYALFCAFKFQLKFIPNGIQLF